MIPGGGYENIVQEDLRGEFTKGTSRKHPVSVINELESVRHEGPDLI